MMLRLILLNIFGFDLKPEPARLGKKTDSSLLESIDSFALRYAHIFLPLAIIILIIVIATLIGVMVAHGGANVTMVESGNYYNHFKDVI